MGCVGTPEGRYKTSQTPPVPEAPPVCSELSWREAHGSDWVGGQAEAAATKEFEGSGRVTKAAFFKAHRAGAGAGRQRCGGCCEGGRAGKISRK